MSDKIRVLVVDDDQQHLALVERMLGSFGMEVRTCESALGASKTIRHEKPDVVLLDVNMDDLTGDQLLGVARRHAPEGTQFVLYSAHDDTKLRQLAGSVGADGWISKSADATALAHRIQEHANRRRARS